MSEYRRASTALVFLLASGLVAWTVSASGTEALAGAAPTKSTTRISVGSAEAQVRSGSGDSSVSADGRYVTFTSRASRLVPNDTNNAADVFVRDRKTKVTRRVSVATSGRQGNDASGHAVISADGRYVAFTSAARNLVPHDANETVDVFIRDRTAKVTRLVSVSTTGSQAYMHGTSFNPAISADGRYVAFGSVAENLVPGDTNYAADVFLRDRLTRETTLVSVATDGTRSDQWSSRPGISADGRYVAYESRATNLVGEDTDTSSDVFVRDRFEGTTQLLSMGLDGADPNGASYRPVISADGQYVAFESNASNLVSTDANGLTDVFVRDRDAAVTLRVSVDTHGIEGNGGSSNAAISAHGRYVAFQSKANNLVSADTNNAADVFLRDRASHVTRRTSVATGGAQGNSSSSDPALSANGRYVAFSSRASNLVDRDTNGTPDVFMRDRGSF